jgi:hypothetical protein
VDDATLERVLLDVAVDEALREAKDRFFVL